MKTLNDLKLAVVANDDSLIFSFFDDFEIDEFASKLTPKELEEFYELFIEAKQILIKEQKNNQQILNKLKTTKEFYYGNK